MSVSAQLGNEPQDRRDPAGEVARKEIRCAAPAQIYDGTRQIQRMNPGKELCVPDCGSREDAPRRMADPGRMALDRSVTRSCLV